MTTSSESNQASTTKSSQQGTSSSTANTTQYGTNTNATTMAQNTTNSSKTGPAAAAMAILQKYGTNGLSQEDINKYMDPNLRDRLSALTEQQKANNAVQQNALRGNSISQGALGGDRARIAQAELMRGQGLNDASALQAEKEKAYTQALTMAQSDRSAALQAAGMMGTETSGTANTTGTGTSTGTTYQQGTQNTTGEFQSSGQSSSSGYSNTTSGPGGGWGMAAGILGMMADGGRVHRDMGGGVSYLQPMAIPALQSAPQMHFATPTTYSLPKIGNKARSKINGMMDKLTQPGGKENAGTKGGGGGGTPPMQTGSGGGSGGASMAGQEAQALSQGATAGEGASMAGEGAGAATEGAATAGEGAAAAGEGMAAAGEGAAAAGEGAAAAGEGLAAAGEGAAAAGEGMAGALEGLAALFSDERVKENKRVIGKTFDGQHIYAFNYKGHPATQIGLMAQEVERTHPEAVGEQNGVKTVRYDQATHDAAKRGRFADGGYSGDPWGQMALMARSRADEDPERVPVVQPRQDVAQQIEEWNRRNPEAAPAASPSIWETIKGRVAPNWTGRNDKPQELPPPGAGIGALSGAVGLGTPSSALAGMQTYKPEEKPVIPTPAGVTSAGLRASTEADSGQLTSAPKPQGVEQQPVKTFRVEPPASVLAPALGGTAEPGADQIAPSGTPATGISDNGMEFIKSNEGFSSRPKWDYKQNSIGYGVKALPGETTIDPEEAESRARAHADKVASFINNKAKVPLAQHQYDALVSFGYNLGTGEGGLSDIMPLINKGDFQGAAEKMQHYNHAGGKVIDGLTERRAKEVNLLLGENVATGSKPPLEPTTRGGIGKGLESAPKADTAKAAPATGDIGSMIKKVLSSDKTTENDKGGILKRLLGIDFNPLKLSDNERMALIAGGFSGNAGVGANTYATLRGQDLNQAQSAAQLAETKRQHIASTGLQQQSIDQAKTSFGVIGQNPDGTPQYGFVDAAGQTLKPASTVLGTPVTKRSNLQGEEHLATLDPYIAEQARRVSQGLQKLPVPSKYNPSAKPIADAVRQAYPDYSEGSYDFIQKWNDPDKGTSKNIKAANTFYQHAGKLYDLADALPSSAGGKFLNTGKLWFRNQTNDPNLAAYIDVAKQVVDEKIKAITGASPTVSERDELMKDYDPAKGKETIRRVLAEDSHLIEGRSKAVESDYNKHIPRNAPKLDVFDEESKKVMARLKGESHSNRIARPQGMSTIDIRKKALEEVEKAVAGGADRAAATAHAQQQLKAMGAL